MQAQELEAVMKLGLERLFTRLDVDMPHIASRIRHWAKGLGGSEEPSDYFLHPVAFPFMALPWWLERQITGSNDTDFQAELVFSNASGYYYTRLVDNIMDGHATVEQKLLPATGYFVNQFRSIYNTYFNSSHSFWEYFQRTWSEFCDVTAADGHLVEVDRSAFENLVAHKVCGAKIAVAAVCFRYEREELIPLWDEWINTFGCWHLFREDLFDWYQDLELGVATYFLCEARIRKRADEAEASWIAREGLDWSMQQLDGWMQQLHQMTFVPQEVASYLDDRIRELIKHRDSIRPAFEIINKLSVRGDHG